MYFIKCPAEGSLYTEYIGGETSIQHCLIKVTHYNHTHVRTHTFLTILQGFGDHLLGGRPSAGPVRSLHHHAVLGKLLQVVQCDALRGVSCGVHTDDGELVAATRAVLPVAHLVAPDHTVLQMLVRRL